MMDRDTRNSVQWDGADWAGKDDFLRRSIEATNLKPVLHRQSRRHYLRWWRADRRMIANCLPNLSLHLIQLLFQQLNQDFST